MGKEKLLALQAESRYVFHGSPVLLEELTPRQPTITNMETGKQEGHGDPCVAATPLAEIAIFRAIVNPVNFPFRGYGSSFGVGPDGNPRFSVTEKVLRNLAGKIGYVYVFERQGFSQFSEMEYRSAKAVKPIMAVAVSAEDLPENIEVMVGPRPKTPR